jgi:hypothetical protein
MKTKKTKKASFRKGPEAISRGGSKARRNMRVLTLLLSRDIDRLAFSALLSMNTESTAAKALWRRHRTSPGSQLRHVRYLMAKVPHYLRQGRLTKAQSVVDFSGGVLWSVGEVDLDLLAQARAAAARKAELWEADQGEGKVRL